MNLDPSAIRRSLAGWFGKFGRDLPWRRTHDAYAVTVSELMLQQTQVATVIPFFERWMARFPTWATLAAASESEVLAHWQGLGYYARARNLHRAAQHVLQHHGGALPDDSAAITALPGVGRYTAGAIASFAFDRPVAAVDANIARVLARLTNVREPIDSASGAARVWEAAEALLPRAGGRLHNSAVMELGALLCTARKPQCLLCPIRKHCGAAAAGDPERVPVKKPRRQTIALAEECAWIVEGERILLERQTGPRWRGLWKLPRLSGPTQGEPLLRAEYPFTHHRVTLRVFAAPAPASFSEHHEWFPLSDLRHVALPSPHRRAIEQLSAGNF